MILCSRISRSEIEKWVKLLGGATLVLDTPYGIVHFTSDPGRHKRLVESGEVAFSPLEVLELLQAEMSESAVRAMVSVKKVFGSDARVVEAERATKKSVSGDKRRSKRRKVRARRREKEPTNVIKPPKKSKKDYQTKLL